MGMWLGSGCCQLWKIGLCSAVTSGGNVVLWNWLLRFEETSKEEGLILV
jgi:hypothetical protein